MDLTPATVQRVWNAFVSVCEDSGLTVAVASNAKGAAAAGAGAFVGGLVGGPIGMAFGALAGAITGGQAFNSQSVVPILMRMSGDEKRQFVRNLAVAAGQTGAVPLLASLLFTNTDVREIAMKVLQELLGPQGMTLKR